MRIKEYAKTSAFWLILFLLICSCNATKPFYQSKEKPVPKPESKQVDYSLFLIGDTGAPQLNNAREVLQTLQTQLQQAGSRSSVVFLGDNLYPEGMPLQHDPGRKEAEEKLIPALNSLRGYAGKSFFIPGNHDWKNGLEGMKAQEKFIEQYPKITSQLVPDNGCPGPVSLNLSKKWQLIVLDSEWWISQSFKTEPPAIDGCKQQTRSAVMQQTEDLIDRYDDKNVLVAFHHTLYSNGTHGGYYPLKDHIFPLTNLYKNAYLPLPLVGSLYPIGRQLGGFPQDLQNKGYREFRRELLQATEDKEHVFFAAGHEHNLAFYEKDKANTAKEGKDFFILSGAGSKKQYARKGYGAEFIYYHKGFAKVVSYTDGSVAVEYWVPDNNHKYGRLAFRKQLLEPGKMLNESEGTQKPQKTAVQLDSTKIAAGPEYSAGRFKRLIWGNHYRDAWTQKVQARVLDLETEKGGFDILEKTGGVQTVTIIAEDSAGRKYVMRSVQKDPTKSLPEDLRKTFAADIAKDQTSATHPYGGEVAAALASAADIYHTTPELRYIRGASAFESDTGDRSGTLVTMEEFVNIDWFNRNYEKKAVEMIDTDELWERMREDSSGTIDETQLVRSRLFDMYIGDWDRHEKQWFWAKTLTDTSALYEPIPIDRDNAFYRSDGLMLGLARRFIFPKFQNFGDDIDNIKGINLNAQYFDRWFINGLSREEWISIARQMQQSITDSAITAAVQHWPEAIRPLNGPTFIEKLKARRDRLPDFAGRYYDLLMRQVNVYGSSDPEEFIVERKADGKTLISLYKKSTSGGEKLWYHRLFLPGETNEVRLYGFGGNDRFTIKGKDRDDIRIRIIGGSGHDTIENQAGDFAGNILVYDTNNGSTIEGGAVNDKRSENPRVNRFEKRGFRYNFIGPLLTSGFNETDGLFIGGGIVVRRQAFRKHPFSARHRITGKTATRTPAFSLSYDGQLTERIYGFDVDLAAEVVAPNRSVNYFGTGNGTEKTRGSDFYGYRMDKASLYAGLSKSLVKLLTIRGGIGGEYYNPTEEDNQFITSPAAGLNEEAFGARYYATLSGGFTVDATNRPLNPQYGTKFNFFSQLNVGLNEKSSTFNRIRADMSIYYTFRDITTTLATRGGFATNVGDYSFFQANALGGQSFSGNSENLRGYLRNRFAGRTSLFHNTELRTKLFDINSYFIPGTMGVLAFLDEGRVWTGSAAENASRWHFGYGGGLWFSPFDSFVLTGGLAFSTEETMLNFSLGFPF